MERTTKIELKVQDEDSHYPSIWVSLIFTSSRVGGRWVLRGSEGGRECVGEGEYHTDAILDLLKKWISG